MNEMRNDWIEVLVRQMGTRLRLELEGQSNGPSRDIAERLERLRCKEVELAASAQSEPRAT